MGKPGLVVIQEWMGVTDQLRSLAGRFEAEGFITAVPDLYEGKVGKSMEENRVLMQGLREDGVKQQLRGAIETLRAHPEVGDSKVGVLGFCMGGRLALYAGCSLDHVGAVVDFYGGSNPAFPLDLSKMRAPVLGIFGAQDKSIPPEAIESLRQQIKTAGKHIDVAVYPSAGHAFLRDTDPALYHPEAAADAFERAVAFLKRFLAR